MIVTAGAVALTGLWSHTAVVLPASGACPLTVDTAILWAEHKVLAFAVPVE